MERANKTMREIGRALLIALWFMFLTFPIMVVKVNTLDNTIIWRWKNLAMVGIGAFVLALLWRYLQGRQRPAREEESWRIRSSRAVMSSPRRLAALLVGVGAVVAVCPALLSSYQVSILTTAYMYVMLGLGLNIVVGLAGLLDLGYVAFYAVGAYCYALLYQHFGLGFWTCLPLAGILAAFCGILLGFPILRLRGDYLAIVTLGFGQIVRIILENWNEFSSGPSGVANIPHPGLFGVPMNFQQANIYLYYIVVGLVIFTIFVVRRLKNSRMGRAWIALREDEVACQAMGIDKARTKLTAFALGAFWAGLVGCLFAAKNTFVNPASFTFMESAIILSIVVLGGMGSIFGVILAAFILILLPEYLRAFSDVRMLVFGASMVIIMVFRPQGLISEVKQHYAWHKDGDAA